jgi:hypothetical protein
MSRKIISYFKFFARMTKTKIAPVPSRANETDTDGHPRIAFAELLRSKGGAEIINML